MKEINELIVPDNLMYAEDHEWTKQDGENAVIGIDDYAQDRLGEIVFVELPEVGDSFAKGDEFGTIESVKAVSELYMPVSGEIIEVNEKLEDAPELVNLEPYNNGWIIKVKVSNQSDFESLMDKASYIAKLSSL